MSSVRKNEKKKVKRMVNLVKQGKRTKRDVDAHFKAFKASVAYGNLVWLMVTRIT